MTLLPLSRNGLESSFHMRYRNQLDEMHGFFEVMLFLVEYVVQCFGIVDVEMFSLDIQSATRTHLSLVWEDLLPWVHEALQRYHLHPWISKGSWRT